MPDHQTATPDSTAVRTALWRALHVMVDAPPHVLEDEIGLRMAEPDEGWQQRPDMHPNGTRLFRASIVARARYIEDLVVEQSRHGINQYVILGAGLDSFVQRRPELAARLKVFEIDQPGTQAWKRKRLQDLGYGVPAWLRLVPVDFEAGDSWLERLGAAGYDAHAPAILAAAGVSMYLTRDAIMATLRQIATLAPGSILAMTFLRPLELADPEELPGFEASMRGAKASGTPFVSFFAPEEMVALALEAGFKKAECVSAATLNERYYAGRPDGMHQGKSEALLLATT